MSLAFPNWSDDSAYPKTFEDWPLYRWAWEFLRRNVEYQADYRRYQSLPAYTEDGKTGKLSGTSIRVYEAMEYRYCEPPALPGETGDEYLARMEAAGIEYVQMPLEERLMEKWCLLHLLDPLSPNAWWHDDDDGGFCMFIPYGEGIDLPPTAISIPTDAERELLKDWCRHPKPDEYSQITLRFDVRYPIDRQVEAAKNILVDLLDELRMIDGNHLDTVKATGPQKRKLSEYLRAFDADQAGANSREIAKFMYPWLQRELTRDPGITTAENAVAAGRKIVTGGYKDLLRWT